MMSDEEFDRILAQEKRLATLARLICDAMSGNPSLFDNLSQPMLVQIDQGDFYSAAQAVIEVFDAEVA